MSQAAKVQKNYRLSAIGGQLSAIFAGATVLTPFVVEKSPADSREGTPISG